MSLIHYFSRTQVKTPEGKIVPLSEYHRSPAPSDSLRVSTPLSFSRITFLPSWTERFDLQAVIVLEEEQTDIPEGYRTQSGKSEVQLSLNIHGKEVQLLTGLVGREAHLTGEQLGEASLMRKLMKENQELRDRIEELEFLLQGVHHRFQEKFGRGLPDSA